jgi:hypothetical protein
MFFSMMRWSLAVCCVLIASAQPAPATEPNETFAARTILPGGTLSIMDELTPGLLEAPDTLLGIKGTFGNIVLVDDDGSELGDGRASGVAEVPTNSGSIDYCVTGFGDDGFTGDHTEVGGYEAFIDVYDFFGDLIESFTVTGTLAPGAVDDYSFNDFEWVGGSYDVNIDNTNGNVSGGDVDFFTFTALPPGAAFTAETLQPATSNIDTVLGWYDASGMLVEFNDDRLDGSVTSILEGVVPASGALTFAVTGYPDEEFLGEHTEDDIYELRLTLPSPADFNGDGDVDRDDLVQWRGDFAQNGDSDADGDNDSDGADFLIWQRELGAGATVAAQAAVPEPSGLALPLLALAWVSRRPRRSTGAGRNGG